MLDICFLSQQEDFMILETKLFGGRKMARGQNPDYRNSLLWLTFVTALN